MKQTILKLFLVVFIMEGLVACSVIDKFIKGGDFVPPPERNLQQLNDSGWTPHDSDLDGQAMKVIWNIDSDVRDQLDLTEVLREDLTHYLKQSGIQIKSSKDKRTQHLIEEIERARRNSTAFEGTAEQKVHYYVKASLTKSSLKPEYSPPIWCPFCEEKRKGSCEFDLASGMQIEVLSLPSLKRVKHFSVNRDESYSVDVFDRCPKYNAMPESVNEFQESRSDIVEKLVECSGKSLGAFLAPQAFIEKYHSDGKKHYYLLSSGSAAGFKEGDSVQVLRSNEAGSLILGEASIYHVQPNKSYMEVSDKKLLEDIRQYDKVKVVYSDFDLDVTCYRAVSEN